MKSNLIKLTKIWGSETLPKNELYINPMMIVTLSYSKNDKEETCTMVTTMDGQIWFVTETPEEIKKQTERVNTYF